MWSAWPLGLSLLPHKAGWQDYLCGRTAGFSKQFVSYHGSSLALSPMTPFYRAWIKQEVHTHVNTWWIFTSKIHPRPHFLHLVQHMSNKGTKKSPVMRTNRQPTEIRIDTKKLNILTFWRGFFLFCFVFFSHHTTSDECLYLKNSRYLAEDLLLQPPLTAGLAIRTVGTPDCSLDFHC